VSVASAIAVSKALRATTILATVAAALEPMCRSPAAARVATNVNVTPAIVIVSVAVGFVAIVKTASYGRLLE